MSEIILTAKDRKFLRFVAEHGAFHFDYLWGRFSKQRIRELLLAGFLKHDDEHEWGILDITDAGRAALGGGAE